MPAAEQSAVNWQNYFNDRAAIWQHRGGDAPHVATAGGLHTDAYFNSDFITSQPDVLERIAETVLKPALENAVGFRPDWVVSYAPYGIAVAYACARQVGAHQGYTKPDEDYSTGFDIAPGSRVLVAADDIYSGTGVLKTIEAMESMGTEVMPVVFCLANLSGMSMLRDRRNQDRRIVAAAHIPAKLYTATNCLLCEQGSEPVEARSNWERLLGWTL